MKPILYLALMVSTVTLTGSHTFITTSPVSNDAIGASIAVFEDDEELVIRIAYLDGVISGAPGTSVHVRDYDESMTLQGERTITFSGPSSCRFTIPRLSSDGRGVVFYGNTATSGNYPTIPYCATLSASAYTGTGSVSAAMAPDGGAYEPDGIGDSTTIIESAYAEPPGISDIDGSSFHIVFPDLLAEDVEPEEEPYVPIMYWNTGGSVDDLNWSSLYTQPGISGNADYIIYVDGNQVYRATGSVGSWSGTADLCSSPNGSTLGNASSTHPEINRDGSVVVFASGATNLGSGGSNNMMDIFVWEDGVGISLAYSDPGSFFKGKADYPSVSPDGDFVSFESNNENFISGSVDYTERSGYYTYCSELGSTLYLASFKAGSPVIARQGIYSSVGPGGRTVFETSDTEIVSGDNRTGFDIIYWEP
jgi:hypothetical protein